MNAHKKYLTHAVPQLLKELTSDMSPSFGIMTPQHMVEHLVWVMKSSVKDYGGPPESFTESQQSFMRFIERGCHFEHRPSDKKVEDLKEVRMANLQEIIEVVPGAIDRLYQHSEDHIFYNPMMGKATFADMELLHAQHFKWHLEEQYGLGKAIK